jgi:ABC-2 type transport system permease protein
MTGFTDTAALGTGLPSIRSADGGIGFGDVSRMEWIKLRTVRSTAQIMAIVAVGMITLAVLMLALQNPASMSGAELVKFDSVVQGFAGLEIAEVALAVLGVLIVAGEYGTGMIRATFAAVPRRPLVFAAKAAVLGGITLVVGEVLAFASFFIGQAVLHQGLPEASIGDPGVLRAVLMAGAFPALAALTGLGFGAMLRHTAGAIAAVLGWLLILPVILYPLPGHAWVSTWAPQQVLLDSMVAVKPVADSVPAWAGLLIVCGWTALALIGGAVVMARRDA